MTVSDNGRGIPVRALTPGSGSGSATNVESILTELSRKSSASYMSPGAEKGISIAVVNALSQRLCVEIRRDGTVFRQEYKHGIPQTDLLTIGETDETGTSITFQPDPELFSSGFNVELLEARLLEVQQTYPMLQIKAKV